MPYINRKTWTKILEARKGGDADASKIYDKFFDKDCRQDELNRLLDDYKGLTPKPDKEEPEPDKEEPKTVEVEAIDISPDLDRELEGLIDDDVIDDDDFETFLKKKKGAKNRAKKNAGYFAAFDPEGRKSYYAKKTDEKSHQYDDRRRDIERAFNDMGSALGKYIQSVKDQPDDDVEYGSDGTDGAYDGIIGIGRSFGRGWDEQDVSQVKATLKDLVSKYGKKNVLAALNLMADDNLAYRNGKISSIDKAVKKYGDALKELIGGK